MKLLKLHAALSTSLLIALIVTAFSGRQASNRFDEITVGKINVVDSAGRTRVILDRPDGAGSRFPYETQQRVDSP